MSGKGLFSFVILMFSFLLLPFCLASCNGNGGSADSAGEVYVLADAGVPAQDSSSSASQAEKNGRTITADDILTLSNSDQSDSIANIISAPKDDPESVLPGTCTITLSASDIGLPDGGSVTLTIIGDGIAYTADATDSSDGNVCFEIPQIEEGATVTVSVIVKRASGTVVCAGSKTQTVNGGASHISISLLQDDVWRLPDPLTVSASPTSITYDMTGSSSQSVAFSVAGLMPLETGSLSFSWALADGTPLGSGDSVSVDLDTLLGGRPTCGGSYTPAVTVSATYIDEDGITSTSSGTGLANIEVPPLPKPLLDILSNGPAVTGAENTYIAASNTDMSKTTLSLGISNSADMPAGTTLVYTVNGMDINGTPGSQSITRLGSVGYSALPESVIISCTAHCPGYDDVAGDPVTVYFLPRIPPFEVTLEIGIPASTAVADGSGGSVKVHYLSASHLPTTTDTLGSALFTFSASPVAVPAGTTADDFAASGYSYDWTVDGVSLGTDFDDGTVDLHLPNLGITDIASMPTVRTNYTIGCKVSRADTGENVEKTYALTLEPKLHTVCFMSNSSTVAATLPVLDGSSVWDGTDADGKCVWDDSKASPPVIRHPGTPAFFDGWYTDDSLTTPFSLGAAITADADAYARWQGVYEEKRNPSPPDFIDFIDEDGSGHSYLFDMEDFTYSAGTWSSAIKLKNSFTDSTTTVYMDIRGTNKSIGYNHGGIKFFGDETSGSTDGGTINVIFSTSTTGTLELGFRDGTHGNIECVFNVEGNISVDPNCTVSEMKVGSTEYPDWDSFITEARANRSANTNASFRITRN